MRLVHFSAEPLGEVYATVQPQAERGRFAPKPKGLWVSDEDAETSWSQWCTDEDFGTERLAFANEITLAAGANLFALNGEADIDRFTQQYSLLGVGRSYWVNWPAVAQQYHGILITPYVWSRRLSDASWYYPWDCASGCIWDPAAIAYVVTSERQVAS